MKRKKKPVQLDLFDNPATPCCELCHSFTETALVTYEDKKFQHRLCTACKEFLTSPDAPDEFGPAVEATKASEIPSTPQPF